MTNPNGQTTTTTYDALGRTSSQTLPGETAGQTTTSWTYSDFCAATGAQAPCVEVDETQRLGGAAPAVSLSATSLTFGSQHLGTTSLAQTVTLTNTGGTALTISSMSITGANSAEFAETDTCPSTLPVTASCVIMVTFTPAATGARSASLTIHTNGPESPLSVALSGIGGQTIYFSDGFETGDLSQWTLPNNDNTGQVAVQTAVVKSGTSAASLTYGSGQSAFIGTALPGGPQSQTFTRFFFRLSALENSTVLAVARDANSQQVWEVSYNASEHGLDVYFWDSSGGLHWFSTGTNVLSANTWYSVEVQDSETANGVGQAWLNGAAFGSVSADLSTPTPYAQLLLYSTGEGTLSFDDVVVSDRYTGTAPLGSLVDQTWLATATASSDTPANEQTADKAIDGVIDGYPGDPTREWVTQGGGVGSWLKLTWGSPQTVSRLVLYDRPNLNDQITGGTIQFSDGSSLTIGALNNDGSATIFTFPARTITSVQLTVTAVGGSTQNVGLAEFQVFNATSGTSDPTTTVTTRSFYDGNGHLVETRTPGPNGQDVVQYAYYDPSTRTVFSSQAYFVAAYTGDPGAAAYSLPDSSQAGSSTTYNTLRSTTVTDALSNQTTTSNSVVCNAPGTSDGACYVQTTVVDALGHQSSTLTDAFGRELYDQEYTGNSPSTYALYATTKYTYDAQGNLVQILQPDGATLTAFLYDAGGHQIRLIDPDRGTELSFYDADGNATLSVDARGSAGTVYAGYDALDRQLWRSTTNSPTGAYVSYTYDGIVPSEVSCSGITPGSNALGQMTTERFTSGPNNIFTGSYCYGYDARGQVAGEVDTLDGTTYAPIQYAYNDAGMLLQLTYPTTASERYTYDAQGWLSSITRSAEGTTASLVSALSYTGAAGAAGAAGMPDSYVLGGTGACSAANSSILCASFSYDGNLRPTQMTYTHPTSSTPITDYSLGVGYDAVGNITSLSSGVPAVGGQSGGQDNQQFCYDEQDRLTWAGNSGTNPCTGQEVTGTTLPTGSSYTASYQYDVMGRIAQSTLTGALATNPQGAYTYDSQHLHAVDTIGGTGGYTAQYDATGAMTCRAPTGTQTCLSNQTGAQLTYDGEGRLIQWVSADGATTVSYGYDGEGQRFELQVTSGETTTTTTYIGDLEEVQKVSGGATTKMVYFYWGGQQIAEDDNTHWYYPITDHLTSTTVEVDYTGVTAAELFGPYGQVRWAGGTMPTSFAFTGQRSDSATGLDYYGARYYDPQAGRFISADAVLDGQDRYAYVGNNPIEHIDPSGHDWLDAAFSVGLSAASTAATCLGDAGGCAGHALDSLSNWSGMQQDLGTLFNPYSDTGERAAALADFGFSVFIDATVLADGGDWFGNAAKNILEKYAARPKAEWEDAKWLYRGLSSHDDPLQGLHPWNPEDRRFTVIQHVESGSVPGFKGDQYISTTRFFDIAKNKYSMPGIPVAMIDSTKIVGHLIDLSTDPGRYAAGLDPILTPRAWKFSRSDYEVLIEGWVPPEAIRLIPPDWNFHRQGLPDPLPPLGS